MRGEFQGKVWGRFARVGVVAAAVMAMAGCATGYSFVQPNATGSGSYYTGAGPYASTGYYGGGLYASPFGWYGGYGPYGYGSSISFSLGFGAAWPWYSGFYGGAFGFPFYTGIGYPFPFYGFDGYRRFRHRYYHHGGHRHGGHYYHHGHAWTGMTGRHAWTNTHAWRGRRFARGTGAPGHPIAVPDVASFAPQDFVHAPARVPRVRGGMGIAPPRMVDPPPRANDDGFAARRMMRVPSAVAMPREFPSRSAPAFRSAMPDVAMPRAMPQSFRTMPRAMPQSFRAMPRAAPQSFRAMSQPAVRAAPMHFAAPRAARRPGIKVP